MTKPILIAVLAATAVPLAGDLYHYPETKLAHVCYSCSAFMDPILKAIPSGANNKR